MNVSCAGVHSMVLGLAGAGGADENKIQCYTILHACMLHLDPNEEINGGRQGIHSIYLSIYIQLSVPFRSIPPKDKQAEIEHKRQR